MNGDEPNSPDPNENPWYVLATIHGEQKKGEFCKELHEKNKTAWNSFLFEIIPLDRRSELRKLLGVGEGALGGWASDKQSMREMYQKRLEGREFPSPDSEISMVGLQFDKPFIASGFLFPIPVKFMKSEFKCAAEFVGAVFERNVDFTGATFCDEATFNKANIQGASWFTGSKFIKDAKFIGTEFEKDAELKEADFKRSVSFFDARFDAYSDFSNAQFHGESTFTQSEFKKPANFENAVFHKVYPNFNASLIHENSYFTASQACWPPDHFHEALDEPQVGLKRAREHCAILRSHMKRRGMPEDEHFFFRREMTHAKQASWCPPISAYGWFHLLSNYGFSIFRPLVGLACVWGVGVLAIWIYCPEFWDSDQDRWKPYFQSLANIVPYLGLKKLYLSEFLKDSPPWLIGVSILQTVFGSLLIFLFGLGLRTRFRLR